MKLEELYNNARSHYNMAHNIIGFILTHQDEERELTEMEIKQIVNYVFEKMYA